VSSSGAPHTLPLLSGRKAIKNARLFTLESMSLGSELLEQLMDAAKSVTLWLVFFEIYLGPIAIVSGRYDCPCRAQTD
jgi:hypothetical protein